MTDEVFLKLQTAPSDSGFDILPINAGVAKGHSLTFSAAVLMDSLPLWNGLPCFLDHDYTGNQSVRHLAGALHNPSWNETEAGIQAALIPGGPGASDLNALRLAARSDPAIMEAVGFSAHLYLTQENGIVKRITKVRSVDCEFVAAEVGRYGRTHPYIKTQYFSEEIDSQGSMFNPTRLALIFASIYSPPISGCEMGGCPQDRGATAFLLDVAGQDESRMDFGSDEAPLENPARDSASLSIASIDLSTLPTLHAPTYRIVHRQQWTGCNHLTLFGQLKSLVESWRPQYIVIDATGVGEGLWALLDKTFPTRVIPVKFNKQVKSELGWKFLSIIDTGRFRDTTKGEYSDQVRLQYTACRSEVLPGSAKSLRWGVPEGARGPDGQLIHDDFLLADSLVGTLDMLQWVIHTAPMIVPGVDPLERIDWFAPIDHYFL